MRVFPHQALGGALVLAVLVAGCGAPPAARVNLSGYSAEFKQGYSDGCESSSSHRQRRDANRYKADPDYMMGWDDGYSVCRGGR
jgi:hypothetical protein